MPKPIGALQQILESLGPGFRRTRKAEESKFAINAMNRADEMAAIENMPDDIATASVQRGVFDRISPNTAKVLLGIAKSIKEGEYKKSAMGQMEDSFSQPPLKVKKLSKKKGPGKKNGY